jgi:hypothetical protein
MESISNYELIQLVQNCLTLMDAQFQYWLSASFAVVVAGFLAKDILSRKTRVWISILYLLASSLFAAKYFMALQQSFFISDEVVNRGIAWPSSVYGTAPLRVSLFILGFLSTLWFTISDRSVGKVEI